MSELVNFIESYCNKTFLDEDGDSLTIELKKGVALEDIRKFEIDNSIDIPEGLKELLLFSNGINLFGLQVVSLEEMEFFPNTEILSFQHFLRGRF